jgi:methionyl aminopeptidase
VIPIKTPEEIELMAEGGKIIVEVLKKVLTAIKPGVTTMELEEIADSAITFSGAKPSFKTVKGFDFAACINVNEGLVHGLPGGYVIKVGDLVSVDMGAFYKGFHTDLAYTVEVESSKHKNFLEAGEIALEAGISQCKVGNHIGDISSAMQKVIEKSGFTVSRDLVGHGIGKELHEDPHVPGYGKPGEGPEIKEGMLFALEIIYQTGSPEIAIAEDDWTIKTADGSIGGLFEHTVAATKGGPKVLTR